MKREWNVNILWWGLMIIEAIVTIIIITIPFSNGYVYPHIESIAAFLRGEGLSIIIPMILLSLNVVFACRKKIRCFQIGTIVLFPILAWCFVRMVFVMITVPSVCSYTTDVNNLGVYDLKVEVPEEFPLELPEKSSDVKYSYVFQEAGSMVWCIELSWTYQDESELQAEITRIENIDSARVTTNGNVKIIELYNGVYYRGDETLPIKVLHVRFDLENKTVYYVTASDIDSYLESIAQ